MSRFRKKRHDSDDQDAADVLAAADQAAPDAEVGGGQPRDRATLGPFDESEPGAADERPRLDFGSVRVPAVDGMEVRVETAEDGQLVGLGLVVEGSVLQVQAFAAPRSDTIWDDVREEIARGLTESGGQVEEATGPFGPELRARVKLARPDGGAVEEAARFVGVDGPRWFLRGVISGAAAADPSQAGLMEDMFAGVVVVRGTDAVPPRESLPLTIPEVGEQQTPPAT